MYTVGAVVTFTIARPKQTSPANVASIRAVGPNGQSASITPTTDTDPTASVDGVLVFSDTLDSKGVWRYEVLDGSANPIVLHVAHVNVVEEDTTYSSTVKF